jgi:V/A-type H+-transporting ATPase subunit D
MAEIKLTKNELRKQQIWLTQLKKYLPTLQLKKAMLQAEVQESRNGIDVLEKEFHHARLAISHSSHVLSEKVGFSLTEAAQVKEIEKKYENIAGVDVPIFQQVIFAPFSYSLFTTPLWVDAAIEELRMMVTTRCKVLVAIEKKQALEKELREVSIRVNLFEKNLIPKATRNIKRIKVFLGDQELAAVGQAKAAKAKIEKKKKKQIEQALSI